MSTQRGSEGLQFKKVFLNDLIYYMFGAHLFEKV